jgi:hypothetical protein
MLGEGIEEDGTTSISDRFCSAVVNVGGRMQTDARMAVIVVIPTEEATAVGMGVLETAEPVGEVGSVLEGPEL